jgi:hypothetical protein
VKKNIIFSILLSLMMLSTTALPTSAADYTKVGVKVGDTADYVYSNPEGNGIIQIYVQQITGTNVTLNINTINVHGFTPSIVTGDLSGTINIIFLYLVASNLSQGDSAMQGSNQYTIDKTSTMIVTGVNRTVNHISYTFSDPSGSYNLDAYWDKTTGLRIKSNITISGWFANATRRQAGSYITNLASTTAFNTWTTIDPTTLPIIVGGVTAILVAVAIAVFALEKQKKTISKQS